MDNRSNGQENGGKMKSENHKHPIVDLQKAQKQQTDIIKRSL